MQGHDERNAPIREGETIAEYFERTKKTDEQLQRDIAAARGVKPCQHLPIHREKYMDLERCGACGAVDLTAYAGEHHDPVNHPRHYTQHPSGIECIQITEHMGFNLGNAVKYIWRADLKHDAIEDLKKAAWYLEREIKKRAK